MRLTICLFVLSLSCRAAAADKPADDLETVRAAAAETRKIAAVDPVIKDASSPPVLAYLAEQKRRRLLGVTSLQQRIDQFQADKSKESLLPVLKEQLAELQSKPPEQVSFDSAYGYQPTTGLVGYSKKVRLIENTSDGKSVILVENVALVLEGLGTSKYASGKFFAVSKAILVGAPGEDTTYQGTKKKTYAATLVDLETILSAK